MHNTYRLIGHPLGHSLSPFIHTRLFALSNRKADYALCDIPPASLEADLPALLNQVDGLNVTIPHKQRVLPFLDRLEGKAALYQTVNTIAVTKDGTIGYNTDADGFLCALREADIPLAGEVLLLGAGGAATVLACEAALAGCRVTVYNDYDPPLATSLATRVKAVAPQAICNAVTAIPDHPFDLLLNATPVGMYPKTDACPAPDAVIARCAAAFDAIYNPRHTQLLQKAAANGAKTAGGMAMLVWQAVIAHEYWYGGRFTADNIQTLIDDCYQELARHFS